jgi:hypothetical protein
MLLLVAELFAGAVVLNLSVSSDHGASEKLLSLASVVLTLKPIFFPTMLLLLLCRRKCTSIWLVTLRAGNTLILQLHCDEHRSS